MIVTLAERFEKTEKSIMYHSIKSYKSDFYLEEIEHLADDNWGIDEFSVVDYNYLLHTVYFVSGSSYTVEFSDIEII